MQRQLEPIAAKRERTELRAKADKRRNELANKLHTSRYDQRVYSDPLVVKYETRIRELDQIIDAVEREFLRSSRYAVDIETAARKYKSDPTPQNLQTYYREFVRAMNSPAEQDRYVDQLTSKRGDNWTHAYVGSLLVPKADPLGRFILADQFSYPGLRDTGAHVTAVSGTGKPIVLCETHPDNEEPPREGYLRMHSMTPGGARFPGFAFGTAGYLGTVLAAKIFRDMNGIFSWDGGAGRTSAGRKLWEGLVDSGLAYLDDSVDNSSFTQDGDEEEYEENHNVCVNLTDRQRDKLSQDYESSRGDYGYPGDEICSSMTFSYTSTTPPTEAERHYMDFDTVIKEPFYVFVTTPSEEGLLHTGLRNTWAPETNKDIVPVNGDTSDSAFERFFENDDTLLPVIKNAITQEMLTNSFHGDSGFLVLTIAEALARSGAQDKAATYLNRVDVAGLVAHNPRLLEILGQQRLPGIAGLPRDMQRAVLGSIAEAQAGTKIDWSSENPLRLQPLSASTKKRLAKFSDLD